MLYRVIDRLSRANDLDQRPWRIVLVPQYQINAFADEANLIAVYTGIIDQQAWRFLSLSLYCWSPNGSSY